MAPAAGRPTAWSAHSLGVKHLGESMLFRITILLFFCIFNQVCFGDMDIAGYFENQQKESSAFNKTVTDEEIIEYFEAFLKYQPESTKDLRDQTPEDRKLFLENYRQSHTESGVKIPVLRGLSKDELLKFDEIAKYKAEEAIRIRSAQDRLRSFSDDQYRLMVSEATKLIGAYKDQEKKDHLGRVIITKEFPKNLAFLDLESIYIFESHCELLLLNGIGKDIGYSISHDEDGTWKISYFDHYISWESIEVNLGE